MTSSLVLGSVEIDGFCHQSIYSGHSAKGAEMVTELMSTETIELSPEAIESLASRTRGSVITPAHPDYDSARSVYNGMIDKRPAVILRCSDIGDVVQGVNFGREYRLTIAIRGGGHNAAGLGVCDDGIVIDLSMMNGVRVDASTNRVRVEGGATWADVNHVTQPFGLGVSTGIVSSTGVGGLTLGGGFGHISRKYGLTIDNLLSADLVLADGSIVTASETENADLFWAIRGGGGNFGVVTSFEFQAHPVGMVTAGVLFFDLEKAEDVMKTYREFMQTAPRELGMFFGYLVAPPAPFVPEDWQMKNMAKIVYCYSGSEDEASQLIAPFQELQPEFVVGGVMPFDSWNAMFDALIPAGRLNYWKADYVNEISDEMIDIHLEHGPKIPNPSSLVHVYSVNGAIQEVDSADTAYSYRDASFIHVILVTDDDDERMPDHIDYVREYWNQLREHSAGGAYVNFMMDEGDDRVQATYRDNYPRLQEIKAKYDPTNLFRINQNIKPA